MNSHSSLVLLIILTMQFVTNRAVFGVLKWNKGSGEFTTILGLTTYDIETERRAWHSRQEETHNFQGEPLRLTYYQEFGFVNFCENDTKVSGIHGDMWNTLSEILNLTLIVKRSRIHSSGGSSDNDNGGVNGILEDVRFNRTDIIPKLECVVERVDAVRFTTPFWINSFRIFAYAQWQRDRDWVFKQFTVDIWFLVFIFIVIFSVGSLAMQRVWTSYRSDICSKLEKSFFDHIFDTIATICNQGNGLDPYSSNGIKILTVTVSTFFWIILTAYGARLMYSMAHEVFAPSYTDLESLYHNTKLHVVVMNGSLSHEAFDHGPINTIHHRMKKANRVKVVSSIEELDTKICLNYKKYVLMDGIDDVLTRRKSVCSILPINNEEFNVLITSGISKRVENKRSIDIGILKMTEFGITKAIKSRYVPLERKKSNVRQTDSLAIDLNQFSIVLEVLTIGIIASVVICAAENIYIALKYRRHNGHLLQKVPISEKLCFARNSCAKNCGFPVAIPRSLHFMELYNYLGGRPKILWRPLIREV